MVAPYAASSNGGEGVSMLAGARVLLVEDDPASAKLGAVVLRHAACNVQVRSDASGVPDDERSALSAGCDGYVPRPIDVGSFPLTVAFCFARSA
jgi:hypothetical protein